MFTKEESRKKIQELTESFEGKIDFIKTSGDYKEAQIEDEFIKPLFRYLNWNISNEGIQNPSEREFIVQAKGRNGKEPDYLLQLDQKPKFYVEAKHTKYDLQKRTDYIWQAYSYSYSTQSLSASKKVDFALLTDFEEFRFFDCTFPVKDNSILNNYCVIDWTYKDYINKFDELWDYFEKENVRKDSFAGGTSRPTLYLNEKKIKANRIPPDKAFLNDLDNEDSGWRITLAKDIKKYQPEFSSEFITQSVQLILDRFIFIKVLSDREIEEEIIKQIVNRIQKEETSAHSVFEECKDIFHDLDKTYNGSIFAERAELDSVKVSNKTLVGILKDFLPENSRYNFKVIPVEILGTIYEQFLGKVVTTTDKRAKIEYKPEVRKAGGVYYTPDYIVNYIVEKTVGEKLKECKTIDDLLEIKICDPACGSGSFLIAAYDALIQWTIGYYKNKKLTREEQKVVYTDSNGDIRLTSKIKRDILRSCIYGVDIDAQAVEVTKMSLSLKALENTTHYEVHNEVTLFHVCVLPPLEGNIMCGNSLVSLDVYDEQLKFDRNNDLNPFDWNAEFKIIKEKGGFTCILGNPPYFNINTIDKMYFKYLENHYANIHTGYNDIMYYFLYKAIDLISRNGSIGMITSNYYIGNSYAKKLRNYILPYLHSILNFKDYYIFNDANIHTNIILLKKEDSTNFSYYELKTSENLNKTRIESNLINTEISKEKLSEDWVLSSDKKQKIFSKLENDSIPLGEISIIEKGSTSGKNEIFTVTNTVAQTSNFEKELLRKNLKNSDIDMYFIRDRGNVLIYTDNNTDIKKYPNIHEYLKKHKKVLSERNEVSKKLYEWYRFERPRKKEIFDTKEKIVVPYRAEYNKFAYDDSQYFNDGGDIRVIVITDTAFTTKYVLAILNSKLMNWFYGFIGKPKGKSREYFNEPLAKIPIKKTTDASTTDQIIALVDTIMDSLKSYHASILQSEKDKFLKKVEYLNSKIDSLVYQLYDLTPEEIKIVEGDRTS